MASLLSLGVVLSGCVTTERPMPPETEPVIAGAKRWIVPMAPAQISFSDKAPHSNPDKAKWPNSQQEYSGRFSASAKGGLAGVGCAFDNEWSTPGNSSISWTPPMREDERTYALPPPGRFCANDGSVGEACWVRPAKIFDWAALSAVRSSSCKQPKGLNGCDHFLCRQLTWPEE
ncbi:MAG: hypothetical protein JNK67_26455 [Alphaproteobacteria bacterium]|nr:hypothetical protein [Alphaproteobacteria bacterium]